MRAQLTMQLQAGEVRSLRVTSDKHGSEAERFDAVDGVEAIEPLHCASQPEASISSIIRSIASPSF